MDKETLKKLPKELAHEMLVGMGDLFDGEADKKFSPEDLKNRMSAEAVRAASKIIADPWRAVKVAAISGAICLIAGGLLSNLLFCHCR